MSGFNENWDGNLFDSNQELEVKGLLIATLSWKAKWRRTNLTNCDGGIADLKSI